MFSILEIADTCELDIVGHRCNRVFQELGWGMTTHANCQDTLAEASAYASELIGASRTVQAFTNEGLATARFGGEVERAYDAARNSTKARAVLTAIIIFIIFTSVVGILWVGQGAGVIRWPSDSFMIDQRGWTIVGAGLVAIGGALVLLGRRMGPR